MKLSQGVVFRQFIGLCSRGGLTGFDECLWVVVAGFDKCLWWGVFCKTLAVHCKTIILGMVFP